MKKTLGLLILTILAVPGLALGYEQERITDFTSQIVVNEDASLLVQEDITVYASGEKIKRGIYRDFPTKYENKFGLNYEVGFEIVKILKNGVEEPYHIETRANGKRIYFGESDVFLESGFYKYTLVYKTDRQLGYFDDHDELYWNVTGNGWDFLIEHAQAIVTLPPTIKPEYVTTKAYTGKQGETKAGYNSEIFDSGEVWFATNSYLSPNEGLTIVVGWPKGYVYEPSSKDNLILLLKDNYYWSFLLVVLVYYLVVWSIKGRDPKSKAIVPLYEPPNELSASALRYIYKMGYDNKNIVAIIVGLAVKNKLKISENTDKKNRYILTRQSSDTSGLTVEEVDFLKNIFYGKKQVFEIEPGKQVRLTLTKDSLKNILQTNYKEANFKLNIGFFVVGVLLSFIGVFLFLAQNSFQNIFLKIDGIIFVGMLIFVNALFSYLLRAPTIGGRDLLDKIEGFKWFLSVTEKDRINFHHPPEKTPELFEKYLPYAIALDVESEWAEQFKEVLAKAMVDGKEYSPAWYAGAYHASFAKSLSSSMSRSIASASSPPGSSSGFSGGSSGGGGGGGGGGGW